MWRLGAAPLIGLCSLCVSVLWCCPETSRPPRDPVKITAAPGGNTTLLCRAPSDTVGAVKWMKEMKEAPPACVYYNSDGHEVQEKQDLQFAERVKLKAAGLTSGNLSIELTNLTSNDSGMYHCFYKDMEGGEWINHTSVVLTVKDSKWIEVIIPIMVVVGFIALLYPAKMFIYPNKCGKPQEGGTDPKSDLGGQSSTRSKKHQVDFTRPNPAPEEKKLLSLSR